MRTHAERFQHMLDQTPCPFGRGSTWTLFSADVGDSLEALLAPAVPRLRRALPAMRAGASDGFVLVIPDTLAAPGEAGVEEIVFRTLAWLGARSCPPVAVGREHLYDCAWRFRFDGEGFFALAFSGRSRSTSSRFTFGAPDIYLMLQHRMAFVRRFPYGVPDRVHYAVRQAFREAGRPYENEFGTLVGAASGRDEPGSRSRRVDLDGSPDDA